MNRAASLRELVRLLVRGFLFPLLVGSKSEVAICAGRANRVSDFRTVRSVKVRYPSGFDRLV